MLVIYTMQNFIHLYYVSTDLSILVLVASGVV